MAYRKVILHYHLFKNAGSSLDGALKLYFRDGTWVTKEFSQNLKKNAEDLRSWILAEKEAVCFSTHSGFLPTPVIDNTDILPIIFVRHPLDRIVSAYSFEKTQGGNSFGAVLARNTSLGGYIETRLSLHNDRQCRNFHTHRFAKMLDTNKYSEIEASIKAVDMLPFIGVVEQYDSSLSKLENWLKTEGFDDIKLQKMHVNASRKTKISLEKKIENIRSNIGEEIYEKLQNANKDDIEFYEYVTSLKT